MLKKLAVAAVAAMVGVGVASAADYTVKPKVTSLKTTPKTVLLVGNSFMYYNCGVNGTLSGIVKAKGGKLASTMATIGGAGLDWHDVKSYLRPNGLRSYSARSLMPWCCRTTARGRCIRNCRSSSKSTRRFTPPISVRRAQSRFS